MKNNYLKFTFLTSVKIGNFVEIQKLGYLLVFIVLSFVAVKPPPEVGGFTATNDKWRCVAILMKDEEDRKYYCE